MPPPIAVVRIVFLTDHSRGKNRQAHPRRSLRSARGRLVASL